MSDAGMSFTGVLDPDGGVFSSFQRATRVPDRHPATFYLGADGTIVDFDIGPVSEEKLDQKISRLLSSGL